MSIIHPADTGRKLNVHKTFRRRPGRLLNVSSTFNLRPVSTEQWTLFISNSHELRARGCLRKTVCVVYGFVGEMIFCWNHYRYWFVKSVRASK